MKNYVDKIRQKFATDISIICLILSYINVLFFRMVFSLFYLRLTDSSRFSVLCVCIIRISETTFITQNVIYKGT